METGPRLKVLSDRLVKQGIEPAIPSLQGKRFIHYTTAAPIPLFISLAIINENSTLFQSRLIFSNEKVNKQCLFDTPRTVRVSEKLGKL